MLKNGIYAKRDDCEGVHPETIHKYYGTLGRVDRRPGATGAGHPPDETIDLVE